MATISYYDPEDPPLNEDGMPLSLQEWKTRARQFYKDHAQYFTPAGGTIFSNFKGFTVLHTGKKPVVDDVLSKGLNLRASRLRPAGRANNVFIPDTAKKGADLPIVKDPLHKGFSPNVRGPNMTQEGIKVQRAEARKIVKELGEGLHTSQQLAPGGPPRFVR